MDTHLPANVLWLLLTLVAVGLIGIATIVALLAAWRNYNQRQRMLDQGKRMRQRDRQDPYNHANTDVWTEAGRRFGENADNDDDADDDDDDDDDQDDDDDHDEDDDAHGEPPRGSS